VNYLPPDFVLDEPKKVKKRGRPRRRPKLPPFEPGESDRLVAEYLASGGSIKTYEAGEMDPKLTYQHRLRHDKSVSMQVPWLQDTVGSIKKEDEDFTGIEG